MKEDFTKEVFESFPDSLWTGDMPRAKKPSALRLVFYPLAAACAAFAAAVLLLPPGKQSPAHEVPVTALAGVVYTVNDAVRAEIVLPDSTLVTLNSGSTLRLSDGFGEDNRSVTLDGEALFDVHHDRSLPFIVNTPQGLKVKVTGTVFDLNCYSDNELFYLTLLQGSVEVTTRKKEVLHVEPSEQLIIKDEFLNISPKEEPREAVEWTEGILRFDRTPMREAISRIEKWYGVTIVVEDENVYRNSISGVFRTEPLGEVMQLICLTSHLRYTISDKTIRIRSAK